MPYFIASMQDGATVLNKQILAVKFSFLPGEAAVAFTETVPSTVIKLANGKKPYDYSLLVGLQLTREQAQLQWATYAMIALTSELSAIAGGCVRGRGPV